MKAHRMRLLRASILALPLALEPCAALAQGASDPIRVGTVSSLTGLGASSDAWRSAKAYFDAINAAGGIRGRRIEYVVEDDRMDPQAAQRAAQKLAADPGIVALAGGSSVLECAVNHGLYAQAGLMSIPGGGVDPLCFGTPNVAPVNAGPYTSTANALTFARKVLRRQDICVVAPALPGMAEAFQAVVAHWARRSGGAAPTVDLFRLEEPLPGVVQRVAQRGCKAVVFTGPEGPAIQWVQASRTALPGVDQVMLTSAYTAGALKALGAAGEGPYVMAEFEPWSSSSLQMSDWRGLMLARKIEPSSLSQGGYLAAQMLVKVMHGIDGPVTRASVTRALRAMEPVANAFAPDPFVVGAAQRHNPNRSALPLRLVDGRWRVAHPQWIRFEPE
jgi:branched-chain amino acid transport system substrate-binding protein